MTTKEALEGIKQRINYSLHKPENVDTKERQQRRIDKSAKQISVIEQALTELEELKKEISDRQETEESLGKELIKLGNQLEELKRDVKRYFGIIKKAMTFDSVVIDEKEQVEFEELQDKLMKVGVEE